MIIGRLNNSFLVIIIYTCIDKNVKLTTAKIGNLFDFFSFHPAQITTTKGFSLGDELGLTESLGNLEGNKRRSVSNFDAQLATANNNVGVLPAEKLTVIMEIKN